MDGSSANVIDLLILVPIAIFLIVLVVAIKCADCKGPRRQRLRNWINPPFIHGHKRKRSDVSSDSSEARSESDPEGGMELGSTLQTPPE